MKQRLFTLALFAAAFAAPLAAVEVRELNLLIDSKFTPVVMHGRTTAAFGWAMSDNPRRAASGLHSHYLSGEGLFDIEVKDGVFTVKYPAKLHPVYKKGGAVEFGVVRPYFGFEGGTYRVRARVRVERGRFAFSDGHVVKPSPEWQTIDYVSRRKVSGFSYRPVANGGFSITDFTVCPEYPAIGGAINLPDGGKLTKILLPANADYMTRFCIAAWQHWLYKLTGVALPIEVVPVVKPTPGALAVVKGETAPGGWQIRVDKNGVVVTCAEDAVYIPALFDYLRELGYTHYSNRQPDFKIKPDPAFVLKAVDKRIVPRFRYFVYGIDGVGNNDRNMLYTKNTVDYFHLPKATMDHVLNIALPTEIYFKDHPEYYAVDPSGRRSIASYIIRTSPCFANKEAFEIAANNMVRYAFSQPRRRHLLFYIGDGGHSCLCDACAQVNRGIKGNYSQMMMLFYNRLAREVRKRDPEMRVAFGAYADAQEPPLTIPPEPNLYCTYAVSHKRGFPCTMHHECELNKPGFDEIRAWSRYIGRDRLGPMTYRDMRPLHSVERFREYNKYMSYEIFSWIWMGWCPANPFVWTRWNYGDDDVLGLLREFNDHYYGKAGKYVTEINLMLEEFARNYRHSPEEIAMVRRSKHPIHIGLRCGDLGTKTQIDRKMFDRIYALLDRGLAEIGDSNPYARQNTLHEKAYYIYEDLNRYRLSDCRTDEELAAYANRVAELARIAREVPQTRKRLIPMHSTQELFTLFSGVAIETRGMEWCFTPEVDRFLADPVKALAMKPERIPGGLYFPPRLMKGGVGTTRYAYKCPPRTANFIHRASSGRGEITINFDLDRDIPDATVLSLTGLDDDKPGVARFAVEVNGTRVFEGPNTFPENDWGTMGIPVPGGLFKRGINIIKFINTTYEDSGTYNVTEDYTQGWVGFSGVTLHDPNGDFRAFLRGSKKTGWYPARQRFNQPFGVIAVKGGKLLVEGKGADATGAAFFRLHRYPKIAVRPCRKVRIRVTASGEGQLVIGLWPYGPKGYMGDKVRAKVTKIFYLGAERTCTYTFTLHPNTRHIVPFVGVKGTGKAQISAFTVELLPGPAKRGK